MGSNDSCSSQTAKPVLCVKMWSKKNSENLLTLTLLTNTVIRTIENAEHFPVMSGVDVPPAVTCDKTTF